jgi:OmpA-OmpF porin, OOP family
MIRPLRARHVAMALLAAASSAPAAAWTNGPFIVYFDFGSAGLRADARATLDNLVAVLGDPRPRVEIEGHADRAGGAAGNRRLACRRARAAAGYLRASGIAPGRLTVRGFGEERPLADTADGAREPQNRRVEFLFFDSAEGPPARTGAEC